MVIYREEHVQLGPAGSADHGHGALKDLIESPPSSEEAAADQTRLTSGAGDTVEPRDGRWVNHCWLCSSHKSYTGRFHARVAMLAGSGRCTCGRRVSSHVSAEDADGRDEVGLQTGVPQLANQPSGAPTAVFEIRTKGNTGGTLPCDWNLCRRREGAWEGRFCPLPRSASSAMRFQGCFSGGAAGPWQLMTVPSLRGSRFMHVLPYLTWRGLGAKVIISVVARTAPQFPRGPSPSYCLISPRCNGLPPPSRDSAGAVHASQRHRENVAGDLGKSNPHRQTSSGAQRTVSRGCRTHDGGT